MVSVILPVRNEERFIERCLEAVVGQDHPAERLEIIVVDGRSTDATRKIVQRFQKVHPNIILLDNPEKVVPTGFNKALDIARGEVIVRVDGHTIIAPDYVRQCVAALERTKADCVGGGMHAISTDPVGVAISRATSSPFGVGGSRFHYSRHEEFVDSVYLGAWPRSAFERFGRFDPEMVRNQDDEFSYRIRELRGVILLIPGIRSRYYNRSSIKSLWRQYYQYGYWKVRVLQKHRRQMRLSHFVPPTFVGSVVGSAVLSVIFPVFLWVLGGILGLYCFANMLATIITGRGGPVRSLPVIPVAFATMHCAYGSGFLIGLTRFFHKWPYHKTGKIRGGTITI